MSDPTAALPPAAVEITGTRHAVEVAAKAADTSRQVLNTIGESVVLVVVAVAIVAVAAATDLRLAVALGGIVLLVGVALIFVVQARAVRKRAAGALSAMAESVDDATDRVIRQLASIGYAIPDPVALDWVTSPVPSATVPLVHDSVIAARWWRPAEGDTRVFVEAILRQSEQDAALPVLPPLER